MYFFLILKQEEKYIPDDIFHLQVSFANTWEKIRKAAPISTINACACKNSRLVYVLLIASHFPCFFC